MSFKLDLSGLENFQKDIAKKVENFNFKPKTFSDIFDSSFMSTYTDCSNINDFIDNGGFIVNCKEDFEKINESDLDKYVASCTPFKTWNEMYKTAATLYTKNQLF